MKIYSDGYTLGANPSSVGGGFVVMNEDMQILAAVEIRHPHFTNNEAELLGILKATELAESGDTIITDSNTAYKWVKKCICKARPDLREKALEASRNIYKKGLYLEQQPREMNLAGNYIEFTLHR